MNHSENKAVLGVWCDPPLGSVTFDATPLVIIADLIAQAVIRLMILVSEFIFCHYLSIHLYSSRVKDK